MFCAWELGEGNADGDGLLPILEWVREATLRGGLWFLLRFPEVSGSENSPKSSPRSWSSVRFSETVKTKAVERVSSCFQVHFLLPGEFLLYLWNLQYAVEIRYGMKVLFNFCIDVQR